jgi:hypothetical protein
LSQLRFELSISQMWAEHYHCANSFSAENMLLPSSGNKLFWHCQLVVAAIYICHFPWLSLSQLYCVCHAGQKQNQNWFCTEICSRRGREGKSKGTALSVGTELSILPLTFLKTLLDERSFRIVSWGRVRQSPLGTLATILACCINPRW